MVERRQASWENGTSRPIRRRKTTEEKDEEEDAWYQHYGDTYGARKEEEESSDGNDNGSNQQLQTHIPFTVGSLNVHYMPERGTPNLIALQDAFKGQDLQGISEHNLNFSKISHEDQMKQRLRKTWRTNPKSITSWIRDTEWQRNEKQLGGVAMLTHGKNGDYMQEAGEDIDGLARWCWMCFEGQSRIKSVVIQVYRPVLNKTNEGSVYM